MMYVVDSCPVILAKQKRSSHAKIASELCDKDYNSSRDEYYYSVKLHTFAAQHTGTLPTACAIMVFPASDHDLSVARQIMDDCYPFRCGTLYADKAYIDENWETVLNQNYSIKIITPQNRRKMIVSVKTASVLKEGSNRCENMLESGVVYESIMQYIRLHYSIRRCREWDENYKQ